MIASWFWIVTGVLVLWNVIGCIACASPLTASEEKIAKLPEVQRAAWTTQPLWVKGAYVVAVGAGLAGAIALMLLSRLALPLFILSLIGVVGQFGWFFIAFGGWKKAGPAAAIFPLIIALICVFQIALACCAQTQGWIA